MDNYIKNSVKLLPVIENIENKVVFYTEFSGNYDIGDKLYIMVNDTNSIDYGVLDSLENSGTATSTIGYDLLKKDGNKVILDIDYDTFDLSGSTLIEDNCYIGRVYIKNGEVKKGEINSVMMRDVKIAPNSRLDIIWKQGILFDSPTGVTNMDFNNKHTDDVIVFKSEMVNGEVSSFYTKNNNGIGLSMLNLSNNRMSLEKCNINGGTYNKCDLFGVLNTINKGRLNECTVNGTYTNDGGEMNECVLLDTRIVWENGKWKNSWTLDDAGANPFISTEWKNGDWVDGYFPDTASWGNGRFMSGIFDGLIWFDGTFNGGVFKEGTWEDGVFNDGLVSGSTWNSGTFNGGTFNANSTWNGGIFDCGSFSGSTWNDGTFKSGVASYITWNDGIFEDGTFDSSTWNTGIFNGGLFDGSIWDDGNFYGGTFNASTWNDGNYYNGSLFNSEWIKGDLFFGILNNVNWSGGTLHNGLVNSIEFHDGIWLDGIFNFGTFHKGDWYNGSFNSGKFGDGVDSPVWHNGTFYDGDFNGIWKDGTFYVGSRSQFIPQKHIVGKRFRQYNRDVFTTKTRNKKRIPKLKKF